MKVVFTLFVAAFAAAAGDAPGKSQIEGPLELTLPRAVAIAVAPEGSAKVQLALEARKQAQSRSDQSRAALLPDLSTSFSVQNLTRNLTALGLGVGFISPIPGVQFPTFVGPFTTLDARVSGTQSVFDFASIRRFQASKVGVTAAKADVDSAEEQVAAQVA